MECRHGRAALTAEPAPDPAGAAVAARVGARSYPAAAMAARVAARRCPVAAMAVAVAMAARWCR
jgi:hypothetical protein